MLQLRTKQTTAKLLLEMAAQFELTLCRFRQSRSRFRLFRKDGLEFQWNAIRLLTFQREQGAEVLFQRRILGSILLEERVYAWENKECLVK